MQSELSKKSFVENKVWTWDPTTEYGVSVETLTVFEKQQSVYFIDARFRSAGGQEFSGYLVGLHSFYAFCLFVRDEEFLFNLNLADLFDGKIQMINKLLGEETELFPLHYESDVSIDGKNKIVGVFEIPKGIK